jgi:hypothetical protein
MTTMPYVICTALLGLTLVSASEAKPRTQPTQPTQPTPAAPQTAPMLTTLEQRCQELGKLVELQGLARDLGVPLLTLAEELRRIPLATTEEDARLRQIRLDMLHAVYKASLFSPAALRQVAERGCLKGGKAASTEATDTRY